MVLFLSKETASDIVDAVEIDVLEVFPRRHGGILEQTADLDLPNPTESVGELHPQLPALDHRYLFDNGSYLTCTAGRHRRAGRAEPRPIGRAEGRARNSGCRSFECESGGPLDLAQPPALPAQQQRASHRARRY